MCKQRAGIKALLAVSVMFTPGVALLLLLPTPAADAERRLGTARGDTIIGTDQADWILARGGRDDVSAGGGVDFVRGGPGSDHIRLGSWRIAFWDRMEYANGGQGPDGIDGTGARDRINGAGGYDLLIAGPGDDVITDGAGRDDVLAGAGDDLLRLQGGAGQAFGFTGDDFFIASSDGQRDQIGCGPGRDTVSWNSKREMLLDQTTGCERQGVGLAAQRFPTRSGEANPTLPRSVDAGL